jgi:hypothetical protein
MYNELISNRNRKVEGNREIENKQLNNKERLGECRKEGEEGRRK